MSHDSFCIDSSGNVESEKLRNFVYTTKLWQQKYFRRREKWWIKLSNNSNFGLGLDDRRKMIILKRTKRIGGHLKKLYKIGQFLRQFRLIEFFTKLYSFSSETLQGKNSFCSKLTTTYHTYLLTWLVFCARSQHLYLCICLFTISTTWYKCSHDFFHHVYRVNTRYSMYQHLNL